MSTILGSGIYASIAVRHVQAKRHGQRVRAEAFGLGERHRGRADAPQAVGIASDRRRALHEVEHAETGRSEEHTSELQSLMRISYAVFCLKQKNRHKTRTQKT